MKPAPSLALAMLRLVAFVLLLPVALGGALPALARLASGPAAHVCRCDAQHTDCVCPICHPDREDLQRSELAITGTCGDVEARFGVAAHVAVLAAPASVLPALARATFDETPSVAAPRSWQTPPEPRPPRG